MTRPTPRTLTRLGVLAATALCLAGCMHATNDRLRLGQCETVPAFRVEPHPLPPAGPSVTGLDRSGWDETVYVIPVNGVAHSPQYAPPIFNIDTLPRHRGEFPTALSALDLGEPSAGREAHLAFRTHGWAFLDALALVPRLIIRPPNATNWSPRIDYERSSVGAGGCCEDTACGSAVDCDGACVDECGAPAEVGCESQPACDTESVAE